jgi:hypothetical protein
MKVFAPGRVIFIMDITTKSGKYGFGVPLEGEWKDEDDYFRQITSGNVINDVIHAKIVAATGIDYYCGDLVDERGVLFPSSFRNGSTTYVMAAPFVKTKVVEYYYPNYKGKKKVSPRRRERFVRSTTGVGVEIRVGSSNMMPRVNVWLHFHCPLTDAESRKQYGWMSQQFTIRYTNGGYDGSSPLHLELVRQAVIDVMNRHYTYPYRGKFDDDLYESCASFVMQAINPHLYEAARYVAQTYRPGPRTGLDIVSASVPSMPDIRASFIMNEPDIYADGVDPLLLRDHSTRNYWKNYMVEHATLDALESFPKLNDNSISNAFEVLGFIKALVVDHRIEIPSSLSDLWLSYRYQYNTSKMDVKEAVKFVKRYMDLGSLDRGILCRGTSYHTFDEGTTVTCRCQCRVVPQIVSKTKELLRSLDTYGLTPDFYVIWDMIPFSFMVDWFVPIGDMLGVEDVNSKFLSGEFYKIEDMCWSLSYTRKWRNAAVSCYTRWHGVVPSSLNSFYWLEPPSSSSKVTTFRVLDAASIFIGR